MAPQEVRDLLTMVPFRPFRIILSDGTVNYDIDNPAMVFLTNRSAYVGFPAQPGDEFPERVVRLDLLHVTQLIPLQLPLSPQGNGQQTN